MVAPLRSRWIRWLLLSSLAGCTTADRSTADRSTADRSTSADSGTGAGQPPAARQAIPPGVDPRMVRWREDGVLVASDDSLRRTPGYVVDSIFPPEEAMRRFRAGLTGSADMALTGGARSTDALLRRFWTALEAGDTTSAGPLVLTKAEFAFVYLPESVELASGMPPQIAWLMLDQSSSRGFARAVLQARANRGRVVGSTCAPSVQRTRTYAVHGPCAVILSTGSGSAAPRDTVWIASRLIQRGAVFKLLSFANPL